MMTPSLSIACVCFHGSPGGPEDFSLLEKQESLFHWLKQSRFENVLSSFKPHPQASVFLVGYSFGAAQALIQGATWMESAQFTNIKGFILISPYVFQKRSLSWISSGLLKTPFLGDLILNKFSGKKIEELLVKSSSPDSVPSQYRNAASSWKSAKVLKQMMFEKEGKEELIEKSMQTISKLKIPVAIIFGDQDKTSLESEQISPLRQKLSPTLEIRISNAGHALPWTRPKEVVKGMKPFISKNFKEVGQE